ncbi:retrovirus-related pol polyprotein from transposon TNT 1-94 [Tanacetum coccineum]
MSNSNINLQTQSSNALHNAIMEAGSKDRPPSNTDPVAEGSSETTTEATGYDIRGQLMVLGARENVGTLVVQKSGIQCYNCKEYGHVSRECQKPKRLQEVTPDQVDNSGPIFDDEPMHKVQNNNDNYNVFAMENEHPEQPESNQDDQDDTDDLDQERDLLASLIQKLKCEIDDSKNRNKFLESSNKALVDKLKGEIEDFKTKNKSLESSNNHFKEANNELSKTNQLMFKDLKKFQAELDKYNDVNYASKDLESSVNKTKDFAISGLKKLIEKMKGKSVETKFEKSSVIRQLNAFKSQRQSILEPQFKSIYWKIDLNAKTSNVNFVCVTCGKCVLNDNHDLCVLHYINGVNSRTRQPIVVPISTREPKHNVNQSVATSTSRDNFYSFRRLWGCSRANDEISNNLTNFVEKFLEREDHVSSDPGPQCSTTVLKQESLSPDPQSQENVSQATETETTSHELELLYSLMFSELLNGNSHVVSDTLDYLDSRKSTSGGIQFLGGDKLVSWSSKKQDCTSMSSAEAEYVSLSACCAQVLWLRTQLTDYGFYFDKIPMYCDSKAAIAISCNPVQHSCTKHIDVRYHFIKEQVEKGIVELFFVETEYQLADLFTKALSKDRFKYLVRRLGMRCLTPDELEVLAIESA